MALLELCSPNREAFVGSEVSVSRNHPRGAEIAVDIGCAHSWRSGCARSRRQAEITGARPPVDNVFGPVQRGRQARPLRHVIPALQEGADIDEQFA